MDKRTAKRIACSFTASVVVPMGSSEDYRPFLEDGYTDADAALIVEALRELTDELFRRSGSPEQTTGEGSTVEAKQLSLLPIGG